MLSHKAGDTWVLNCERLKADGSPVPIGEMTISAQLRRGDAVVEFAPEIVSGDDGEFVLKVNSADTLDLPTGEYNFDVSFNHAGTVISSSTIVFQVDPDNTRED